MGADVGIYRRFRRMYVNTYFWVNLAKWLFFYIQCMSLAKMGEVGSKWVLMSCLRDH